MISITEAHRRARSWLNVRWLVAYTVPAVMLAMLYSMFGTQPEAQLVLFVAVLPALAYGVGMACLTAAVVISAFWRIR